MPENNWKSCDVDGEIYGINGKTDLVYGPPSYIVNKNIMDKYNISVEDLNKPIYELESILKLVAEGEKANPNFKPISLGYTKTYNVFGNTNYTNIAAVTFPYEIMKKAKSVLDEPENLRWLKTLCEYANKGLIGKETKKIDDMFLTIDTKTSLPYMIPHYMYLYNKDGKLADSDDVIEIVLNKYYDSCLSWDSSWSYLYADCIFATSKHKDEAFDFLMKVYTDPYLTNLLYYGIENKTYVMIDGKVEWPDIYYPGYGNTYIAYPRNYEYADKKERYWKLYDELPYTFYDFVFDPTNVKDEFYNTLLVMDKVSDILTGNVTDFDAFIADIRKQLDNSGIQKIIDEVNQQREEWINSKKEAKEVSE
jgi:putative aldouronate transport system substrate-binding protein